MKAVELRKELGLKPKDISIRIEYGGYSKSIEVNIKNLMLNRSYIENKLSKYKDVSKCETSGEILMGGNTYINVSYDYEVMEAASKKIEKKVEEIYNMISNLPPHQLYVLGTLDDKDIVMYHDQENQFIKVKDSYFSSYSYIWSIEDLAVQLIHFNTMGELLIDGLSITDLILS